MHLTPRLLILSALLAGSTFAANKVPSLDEVRREIFAELHERADNGDAIAQNNMGTFYFNGSGVAQDNVAAAKWFRKSADLGYVVAQHNLACMYAEGRGVPKDMAEAAKWFRKAAERGYTVAQYNLGSMYRFGNGVPKDPVEGAKWLRKAAEYGDVDAKNSLGYMYASGDGVEKDLNQAHLWWISAASEGSGVAKDILAELEKDLNPAQKSAARQKARAMLAGTQPKLDVYPVAISQAAPKYPYKMRYFGVVGEVHVDYVIDVNGNVQNAYVSASSQFEFEAPAVEAVKKWKYRPGRRDGHPVEARVRVPIIFTLTDY